MIDPNFHIFTSRQVFIPTGGSFDSTPNSLAGYYSEEEDTSRDTGGQPSPSFDTPHTLVSAFTICDHFLLPSSLGDSVRDRADIQQTVQDASRLVSQQETETSQPDELERSRIFVLKSQ